MTLPLFSVVIPTYNRASLICATLESLGTQEFRNFETIVVDDGSTDETCSIVERFSDVRLMRQRNSGPGAARNLGVSAASGKFIAFLDSDDLWFPWTLDTYANVVESYPQARFVTGCPFRFESEAEIKAIANQALQCKEFTDYCASYAQWTWFGVSSFVIERNAFREAGGFRKGLVNGEDAELALRMATVSTFVQVTSPHTFAYRSHAGNITNDLDRAVESVFDLIEGERKDRFPGGSSRACERRKIITRHLRPACLSFAQAGRARDAAKLYRQIWRWNLAQGRLRFLLGLPLALIWARWNRKHLIR